MLEYLLVHNRSQARVKPNITKDASAAVLSFQRRTHAFKERFLLQNQRTPLAVTTDYWDRTEAQTRQALHSHIPFWAKRRKVTAEGPPGSARPCQAESALEERSKHSRRQPRPNLHR